MPLTKVLAAISAGSLLLIGQSALAQDSYTDRTQDRQATTQTQTDRDSTQARVRTQDEDDDAEFTAEASWDDDDDTWDTQEDTTADAEFQAEHTQDDEFRAETDTRDEFATESEFATEDEWSTEQRTTVGMTGDVDQDKLETLAQIHIEMQDATRELADELAVAASAEEAQEFQTRMVDRQVQVIERHGWSRDEYNAIVDQVNEDAELRADFIDMVVQRDEQVAGTRFETETETESEFRTETDSEFQAEADFDDDDWDSDTDAQASVELEEDRDETVAREDDRDW